MRIKPTEFIATTAIFASAVVFTGVLATASVNADPPSPMASAGQAPNSQPVASAFAKASTSAKATADKPADKASGDRVVRGKYLVDIMGCHDCHTPWKIGPNGPEMDMSRALTGHPQDLNMPPAPAVPPGPWMATFAATMTAWSGPWGTSFTMNLTPDKETGLGDWTEEQFIATMKTGRDRGKGRPLLPPMPYFNLGRLSDEDIRSVFAYLQSLPPVKNRVPQPIDPPEPGCAQGGQR